MHGIPNKTLFGKKPCLVFVKTKFGKGKNTKNTFIVTTGGKVGTPYTGREGAPPERGTVFRLRLYERERISLLKIYKRLAKIVISVC